MALVVVTFDHRGSGIKSGKTNINGPQTQLTGKKMSVRHLDWSVTLPGSVT